MALHGFVISGAHNERVAACVQNIRLQFIVQFWYTVHAHLHVAIGLMFT